MTTWAFYADAGLTIPFDPIGITQGVGATDVRLYYGSSASGKILQCGTGPGVDPVRISVVDAASGSGLAPSVLILALAPGDLDTNTPGDHIDLGATLNSGIGGAMEVYLRFDSGAAADGTYTDLSLRVANALESDA